MTVLTCGFIQSSNGAAAAVCVTIVVDDVLDVKLDQLV